MKILGIDTSNYTTSVAFTDGDGYRQKRRLLEVASGERGLRQSNALFLHIKNLPELFSSLEPLEKADAVACSDKPRDEEGSYMPCFLAGVAAAQAAATALGVPLYRFSHQSGHIAAAAKTCGNTEIVKSPMLCFHVSGGTTELVYAVPDDERGFCVKGVGGTRDISAGQLIDRAGVLLGLDFPCGGRLEELAGGVGEQKVKISASGAFCNYSGAENNIIKMKNDGVPAGKIARYALDFCAESLISSVLAAQKDYPGIPVLFAGGVMRDEIIRSRISERISGARFGSVELSSDNAVGIAWLGAEAHGRSVNGN